MTEEVVLTIRGEQTDLGEDAATEIITSGKYYLKNGKHYVVYDETQPDDPGPTTSTLKIAPGRIDVIRRGVNQVHMVFDQGKEHITSYQTMMGQMIMESFTSSVRLVESEHRVRATAKYTLSMNGTFVSECKVEMIIESKGFARLNLTGQRGEN